MLYLVEHFYSIQGEGAYVGTPSLFFRFGGCNMKCEGFECTQELENGTLIKGCDTIYAVDKENFSHTWAEITKVDELLNIFDIYELPEDVDVVITGGEPLININDDIFISFIKELVKNRHRVTFETNATLAPNFEKYPFFKECVYALSVKLSNSGESYQKRINPKVISSIVSNSRDAFFKFSIDSESIDASLDDEIEEIISYGLGSKVYCMPVAQDKKELEQNTPALIEYCKDKGYNFSDRLHMRVWDKEKGV
ncbi:7-carboxy-7-deazaguanine synthase QueE [Sulfurimonas sp.]|uniref:7-carboxy-7-deazaguanine synthase QueE n=1 Tax=Sulfurimonas sp. TaxID=2022749 RepID=UPI0035638650